MPKRTRFAPFCFSPFRTIICMSFAAMAAARYGGVAYADTESSAFPRDGATPHLMLVWNDPHRLFPLASKRVKQMCNSYFRNDRRSGSLGIKWKYGGNQFRGKQ